MEDMSLNPACFSVWGPQWSIAKVICRGVSCRIFLAIWSWHMRCSSALLYPIIQELICPHKHNSTICSVYCAPHSSTKEIFLSGSCGKLNQLTPEQASTHTHTQTHIPKHNTYTNLRVEEKGNYAKVTGMKEHLLAYIKSYFLSFL